MAVVVRAVAAPERPAATKLRQATSISTLTQSTLELSMGRHAAAPSEAAYAPERPSGARSDDAIASTSGRGDDAPSQRGSRQLACNKGQARSRSVAARPATSYGDYCDQTATKRIASNIWQHILSGGSSSSTTATSNCSSSTRHRTSARAQVAEASLTSTASDTALAAGQGTSARSPGHSAPAATSSPSSSSASPAASSSFSSVPAPSATIYLGPEFELRLPPPLILNPPYGSYTGDDEDEYDLNYYLNRRRQNSSSSSSELRSGSGGQGTHDSAQEIGDERLGLVAQQSGGWLLDEDERAGDRAAPPPRRIRSGLAALEVMRSVIVPSSPAAGTEAEAAAAAAGLVEDAGMERQGRKGGRGRKGAEASKGRGGQGGQEAGAGGEGEAGGERGVGIGPRGGVMVHQSDLLDAVVNRATDAVITEQIELVGYDGLGVDGRGKGVVRIIQWC